MLICTSLDIFPSFVPKLGQEVLMTWHHRGNENALVLHCTVQRRYVRIEDGKHYYQIVFPIQQGAPNILNYEETTKAWRWDGTEVMLVLL